MCVCTAWCSIAAGPRRRSSFALRQCKQVQSGFGTRAFVHTGDVDVYSPRHSARPFHHIRSSTACLHPPHPPIALAPAALPPAARATSFAPSPVPLSLLLSSSPVPLSAAPAWHAVLHCLLHNVVRYTASACPQRPEGAPATSPKRRARSDDEVPWSPSSVDCRHSVLVCDRIDNRHNTAPVLQ
jgi:hypothetical protein